MQNEIKELGKKSTLLFIGDIFQKFFEMVYTIIISRLLGADILGQFVFVTAILFMVAIVPKLGMVDAIVYYLSRDNLSTQTKRTILTFGIFICTLISILFIGIIYANIELFRIIVLKKQEYFLMFSVALPVIIITNSRELLTSYFRANRRVKEIIFLNSFFNPILRIVFIVVLYFVFNITNSLCLIISYYINAIISVSYLLYIIMKEKGLGNIFYKSCDRIKFLRYSLPLLLSGIVYYITENTDKYMLGIMKETASLGVYKIAFLFGGISSFGLYAINKIFSPMISNLYHNNEILKLKTLYRVTSKWSFIIGALALGIITINSNEIMLLAGKEFVYGGNIAIIIAIGQLANSSVGSVALMNTMTGDAKAPLISVVSGMIVNVGLNLVLIKDYGMSGAAIATAISLITINAINLHFVYKKFKMLPFDKSFLLISIILLILIGITNLIFNIVDIHYVIKLILSTLGFVGLFVLLIFWFGIEENEVVIIRDAIKKISSR